ncbi:MAG: hypothetical protein H0V80_11485 [Acidobacteria bacterium]|nr:hypothetical protein [Acidobacteriota bacterium]
MQQSAPPSSPPRPTPPDQPTSNRPAPRDARPGSTQMPAGDVPLIPIGPDETRTEIGPVTPETGVADVLLGAVGLVGVMLVASVILGTLLGGLLVFVKHRLGYGGPDRDAAEHVTLMQR